MRSWLHNCLPSWRRSPDMPSEHGHNILMRRSFSTPPYKPDTLMSVGGAHVDMPPSTVQEICCQGIPSHTRACEFSLRGSLHTSKRSLTTPGFPECQHRLMKVETLAVRRLHERISLNAGSPPSPELNHCPNRRNCYLPHSDKSIVPLPMET
ncbi:unnamed protein product [Trypanosoma congolense IL3000]|uniref:WGS project CAEQ00000000 data, annotated contig 1022 n=1 Tax=Trypanosoma congolense (strain IL3000) TaxID=1068625 RepID=F9W392_TRYCI|nr:unnamed protein product [Trypanosoma congolense IL3000]